MNNFKAAEEYEIVIEIMQFMQKYPEKTQDLIDKAQKVTAEVNVKFEKWTLDVNLVALLAPALIDLMGTLNESKEDNP